MVALALQVPTSFGRSLERVCAPGHLERVGEPQAVLSQGRGAGGAGLRLVGREEAQDWVDPGGAELG